MAAVTVTEFSQRCPRLLRSTENPFGVLRLIAAGDLPKAAAFLFSLPSPDAAAYAALFHACANHRLISLGRSLHRHLLFSSSHPFNIFLSNHLINMYSKCGRTDLARRLFDEMPHRNLVSWTALLTGYSQSGQHQLCFQLFSSMLAHCIPNDYGLVAVLSSIAEVRHGVHGKEVHALAFKLFLDSNVFVGNSLITMYSSCHGLEEDGWLVFKTMPFRNLISWNSMISGFLQAEVATTLIKAYTCLGGDFQDCYTAFSDVSKHDIMSWTGIITACCEDNPKEAVLMFSQLRRAGFSPDRHSLSVAAKACAGFASERYCMALNSIILKSGYLNETVVSNALIHSYARCGSSELAVSIFHQMKVRDNVSWNSVIKAYAAHGKGKEALMTFRAMDVPPDSATLVGVFTACSHCGYVNEGRKIFNEMYEVYGITPQLDHYACMVDILGRAGRVYEAEELINRMPMEPDHVVWSALLGACRKHGETSIGKRAAQRLTELEPSNSIGFVMMSNMYCATRSFEDAAFVRKGMRDCGVKKEPGLSWIEVGAVVHEFSAGGYRHPNREDIFVELKRLMVKLKEVGYVADTRLVLVEIDEELKEEHLLLHSEKMALVFGLMKASSSMACLKIMKNIRICEDCHSFIKLASKCVGKVIVVRDSNRFHRFMDGACSCGNYW